MQNAQQMIIKELSTVHEFLNDSRRRKSV